MSYEIRPMSLGEILDMGFRILRDHFSVLVGLGAVFYLPLSALEMVIRSAMPSDPNALAANLSTSLPLILVTAGLAFLWAVIVWPVASAAITHAVGELYLGRSATLASSLRVGWSLVMPLAGTTLLLIVFVVGGFMLLIIPGIYFMLSFGLVWPIMVLERVFGMAALQRSRHLLRGHLLRVAGVGVVVGVLAAVLGGAVQLSLGSLPVVGSLASAAVQAVSTAFTIACSVLLYFDVRCRKEAFDLEHLARLVEGRSAAGPPATAPLAG